MATRRCARISREKSGEQHHMQNLDHHGALVRRARLLRMGWIEQAARGVARSAGRCHLAPLRQGGSGDEEGKPKGNREYPEGEWRDDVPVEARRNAGSAPRRAWDECAHAAASA